MEETWFALRWTEGENKGKIVAVKNWHEWPVSSIFDEHMVKEDNSNDLQYMIKENPDMEIVRLKIIVEVEKV